MYSPEIKEQARRLFFQSKLTKAQIAAILNVKPRTLFDWIQEGDWKCARSAAANAPMLISERYYAQLHAINETIRERRERPYPTKEESDIIRKLTLSIKQIKMRLGISETMEVFTHFSNYLSHNRPAHMQEIMDCMSAYLHTFNRSLAQEHTNQYKEEEISHAEWEQYRYELSVQDDIDELQQVSEKYRQGMAGQKQEEFGENEGNWQKLAETGGFQSAA